MQPCAYRELCGPGSSGMCARSCGLRWKIIPDDLSWKRRNELLEQWLRDDEQEALDGGRVCPVDPLALMLAPVAAVAR